MNSKLTSIRALAILMVILGHSIIIYDSAWGLVSTGVEASYFVVMKKLINIVQMPLFFALSGYLFYFTVQKGNGFLPLIWNKARRLLVPFLIVGLFFTLPIKMMLGVPGYILPVGGVSSARMIFSKGIMWGICGFYQHYLLL